MSRSRERNAWNAMIQRCYNTDNHAYNNYGERGIKVCDRWRNSFMNYYNDMYPKPTWAHSIDRIDNNGDYEPGNCRWATYSQQNTNKRTPKNNTSGVKGVAWYKPTNRWVAYINMDKKRVTIGYYTDKEEAATARKLAEVC